MPELDAYDLTREQAKAVVSRLWNWLFDHGRRMVTSNLLMILGAALGAVIAGWFSLQVLVAAGCTAAFLVLGGWAIQTQRLLHREREVRYWTTIKGLRVRQREIRAQADLREATLAVAGLRGGANAQMRTYRPLVEAVRFLRGQAREAMQPSASPRQRQRAPIAPEPPDVGAVERQLKDLREEDALIEAEIQALAAPGTKWEERAEVKAEEYSRAKRAALEARKRARQGQRPTAAEPGFSFEVGRNRDGSQSISERGADLTPEQIFEDEDEAA
ncbi:MAG TPA: hypothetical protein VLC07_08330 [Solirubrobacterales bacterium]|nr:hypothetical protein [Solirubrobacterales bacterium]